MSNNNPLSPAFFQAIPIAQASLVAASVAAGYTIIGTGWTVSPVIVIIVSTLDQTVQFSWNGIVDAFPIVPGASIILDLKSDGIVLPANSAPYVKRIGVPASGSIYIGGFSV